MSVRNRVTTAYKKLRGVLDGDAWFEKRGMDRIRRTPTDDPDRQRYRRYQRYLGAGFLVLLGVALWYPIVAAVGMVGCASAAIIVGARRGRKFCDWWCPRGGFLDSYVRLISRGKRTPEWFSHPLFRAGVAVVAFGIIGFGLYRTWGTPAMVVPFAGMLTVSTVVAVLLGITYHERAWCQVCPAGTAANVTNEIAEELGRDAAPRVQIDADACRQCGRCKTVCRQEIDPGTYANDTVTDHGDILSVGDSEGVTRTVDETVAHGDCLQCKACVEECPFDALSYKETMAERSSTEQAS